VAGAVASAVGAFLFIGNIWRTIGERRIELQPPLTVLVR
jgi:phosphate/sulfate permease